jgi:hypothetical protein
MNAANQSAAIRLLILREEGSELLLVRNAHGLSLPSAEIPLFERIAPHVSRLVMEHWNLETYVSSVRSISSGRCQLVEAIRQNGELPVIAAGSRLSPYRKYFRGSEGILETSISDGRTRNYESGALPALSPSQLDSKSLIG